MNIIKKLIKLSIGGVSLGLLLAIPVGQANAQSCVPPPSGLISWWDADAVSGTTVKDIQDGNDGTFQGGAVFAPAFVGEGFSFDGTNYVQITNVPDLSPGLVTVDAWIKPDSVNQFDRIASNSGARYDLFIDSAARLRCIVP